METQPTQYQDISIPLPEIMRRATALSLLLLFIPLIVYWLVYDFGSIFDGLPEGLEVLLLIPIALISIVVHELLHAIGWIVAGKVPPSQIKFGFDVKNLAPYAHAQVDMRAWAYRLGGLLPGIVMGLIPAVVGIIIGSAPLTLFGAFMLSAAVGDVIVFWIIRDLPGDAMVRDHPSQAGCMVRVRE